MSHNESWKEPVGTILACRKPLKVQLFGKKKLSVKKNTCFLIESSYPAFSVQLKKTCVCCQILYIYIIIYNIYL